MLVKTVYIICKEVKLILLSSVVVRYRSMLHNITLPYFCVRCFPIFAGIDHSLCRGWRIDEEGARGLLVIARGPGIGPAPGGATVAVAARRYPGA